MKAQQALMEQAALDSALLDPVASDPAAQGRPPPTAHLVEIWGDTTDTRHLAWSIVIGAVVSLAAFLLASRVLAGVVKTPELARAYAILAGLAGCLLSGVICAVLFQPKRDVVEGEACDPAWREEVLDKLAAESGGLGAIADLPPAVVQELKALQLFELFAARDRQVAVSSATSSAMSSSPLDRSSASRPVAARSRAIPPDLNAPANDTGAAS